MGNKLLTYSEVAALLNIPLGTAYSLKARGELPFVRLGRRIIRFPEDEMLALIASRRTEAKDQSLTTSRAVVGSASPSEDATQRLLQRRSKHEKA